MDSWAMKQKPGCLGYIGDEILLNYVGIISYTFLRIPNPYKTTSTMESKAFFCAAHMRP